MNILVCIKMVSQAQYTDSFADGPSERLSSGQLVINPADAYALELALRIKDKRPSTCITVITMAPQYAEHILRTALAMGADKAVHVSDRAFAGSDTIMTSRILSAAVAKLPPQDLILCGKKAIDSETGHIGPQLASILGMNYVSSVTEFELESDKLCFVRWQDSGLVRIEASLPLLLSIVNGTSMVRSPSIMGLRRSKNADILLLDSASLGFSPDAGRAGSGTETISVTELKLRNRKHRRLEGSQAIDYLISVLKGGEDND